MRNRTAQKYAEKVLRYVMAIGESENAIYGKTKDSLLHLAELCKQIESEITEVLDNAKPRGYDSEADTTEKQNVSTLHHRVETVETKLENPTPKAEPASQKLTIQIQESFPTVSAAEKRITPEDSRKIVHIYAKTLEEVANQDHENVNLNKCCNLIWHWFDKRILYKPKNFKTAHYNPMQLQNYIAAITISLAYHIEKGNLDAYIDKFETWIDSIDVDKKNTSRYLFPFECNEIYKNQNPKYRSLTAMVLWDYLSDEGYEPLGSITLSNGNSIPPTDDAVKTVMYQMEENAGVAHTLLHEYHRFAFTGKYEDLI